MPDALVFDHSPGRRPDDVSEHHVLRVPGVSFGQQDRPQRCRALPSGISVPHMFIVNLRDHAAISLKNRRSGKGLAGRLVWVFFQSFILMIGGFIAPYIRASPPARPCSARWPAFR